MKRFSVVVVMLLVLLTVIFCGSVAFAQAPEIIIFVGEEWLESDVPSVIQEGRTLVPMRAILEALGASVGWEAGEQKVTASKEGLKLEMWVGNRQALVNGVETTMDVPPRLISDRTMIPLRFVSENLGEEVTWEPDLYAVGINAAPAEILPQLPFRETSIAGVRLGMSRTEVKDILGSPVAESRQYSDFLEGYQRVITYPYGEFTFYESEGRAYLYQAEISDSDRAGGSRNIRIGDSVEEVLRKFPDESNPPVKEQFIDGYYRILYGEYDHLQQYGVVRYDGNMNPVGVNFSTEDYLGFVVNIQDGRVNSMKLLIQMN